MTSLKFSIMVCSSVALGTLNAAEIKQEAIQPAPLLNAMKRHSSHKKYVHVPSVVNLSGGTDDGLQRYQSPVGYPRFSYIFPPMPKYDQ